jgi:single-strand selective monofunctional uracil DNA glycosylase
MPSTRPQPAALLLAAADALRRAVARLRFRPPTAYVYNPLQYAWAAHEQYLRLVAPRGARVLFLGMNPGPWGMAQTGVPFGHVPTVRDWLGIDAAIAKPPHEHPLRPIQGLACPRSEVSGERLWGLFRERFGTPAAFFREHFVVNYCPLVFMESSGRNRTPDKLPRDERQALQVACDAHLEAVLAALRPAVAVGVGAFAEQCLQRVASPSAARIVRIAHPSPASPVANRGWAPLAAAELAAAGVW